MRAKKEQIMYARLMSNKQVIENLQVYCEELNKNLNTTVFEEYAETLRNLEITGFSNNSDVRDLLMLFGKLANQMSLVAPLVDGIAANITVLEGRLDESKKIKTQEY